MTTTKRTDVWGVDTKGDLHMLTPEQSKTLRHMKRVVVPLENDEGTREVIDFWTPGPLGSISEGVDGIDPDDTVRP